MNPNGLMNGLISDCILIDGTPPSSSEGKPNHVLPLEKEFPFHSHFIPISFPFRIRINFAGLIHFVHLVRIT